MNNTIICFQQNCLKNVLYVGLSGKCISLSISNSPPFQRNLDENPELSVRVSSDPTPNKVVVPKVVKRAVPFKEFIELKIDYNGISPECVVAHQR